MRLNYIRLSLDLVLKYKKYPTLILFRELNPKTLSQTKQG